jgi:hypothetical protein
LLIIRPFTLNNEPIYYHRILSIVREKILEEKCRRCLSECLRGFNERIEHGKINLQINSICENKKNIKINKNIYKIEDVFDLLLNGYYFHQDISKIRKLESFRDIYLMNIGEDIAKTMFIDMLIEYFSFFNFLDHYIVNNITQDEKDI